MNWSTRVEQNEIPIIRYEAIPISSLVDRLSRKSLGIIIGLDVLDILYEYGSQNVSVCHGIILAKFN